MLRAAIIFFVLGLVSVLLGANGIAGLSIEIGKILLTVFLILAVVSFVVSLVSGKKNSSINL
jgi:uncharacterized membrane protein YtjA (UPF0391 family)